MTLNTDTYLDSLPEVQKAALQQLRQTIISIVPEVTETISTHVPAFHYKGKYLVGFSATKNHLALLVMQGHVMKSLDRELKPYDTGNRIIRFTPDEPLPPEVIKKVLRLRQAEIDQG